MITVLSAHKRAITFLLVAFCAFLLEVLQTAGKAFGRVVGCDSIDLGFSEEDTSRMRSSPSASAGISGSHSAIVIWKRSWRNET